MPLITICQPQIVLNSLLVNFSTLSARKTARSAFPSVLLRLLSVFLAVDDQLQPSDKGRDRIEKSLPSNYFVRSNQMLSPITIYGTSSVLVIIGRKNMPFPPSYSASMLSLSRMVPANRYFKIHHFSRSILLPQNPIGPPRFCCFRSLHPKDTSGRCLLHTPFPRRAQN